MAKRKKSASRKRTRHSKRTAHRRRRRMSAGLAGVTSNPMIMGIAGGLGAAAAVAFLAKPGKDGKPMVEDPFKRLLIVAGGAWAAGKFLKAPPALVNGAVIAAGTFAIAQKLNPKDKAPIFSFADGGEIEYVSPHLLNDAATLADAAVLAEGDYSGYTDYVLVP